MDDRDISGENNYALGHIEKMVEVLVSYQVMDCLE